MYKELEHYLKKVVPTCDYQNILVFKLICIINKIAL